MSRKTSPARREAFFRALSETGNQTIAAERAKVSRSWVSLHQSTDPEFRSRVEAAVAEARARLRGAVSVAPGRSWGSLDGEELVVRGTNGRRTQIARARLRQWSPRAEARFLRVLGATCNVKAACAVVGLSQASAYVHRRHWEAFAKRWDAALEAGYARLEAGIVHHFENMLSGVGEGLDGADIVLSAPVTIDDALNLLRLHARRASARFGRPGSMGKVPDYEDVCKRVLRQIDRIEAARGVSPGQRARDEAEWARRRAVRPAV